MAPTFAGTRTHAVLAVGALALLLPPRAAAAIPCEELARGSFPGTQITLAQRVPAGEWKDPDGRPRADLPALCRVTALLTPSTGSAIRAELWLPLEGWNGRILATGNGGFGGQVDLDWLSTTVTRGFAGVNDDMGTAPAKGMDGSPLVGQPVKWLDWGHRSTHVVAVLAKQVVTAFYGRPAHHAYFAGCSSGGRSALSEAERYPEDYDGIIAGCAAADRIAAHASAVWMHRALRAEPGALPTSNSVAQLRQASLAACGPLDGLDGERYLLDPRRCALDPGTLECRGAEGPACIPAPQVRALRALLAGPRNPRTGQVVHAGLPHGAGTARWFEFLAGQATPPWDGLFRWVFGAGWDPASFDFDRELATVEGVLGPMLGPWRSGLEAFEKRGGKLILWHGWEDAVVPAGSSIDYYERLAAGRGGPAPLASLRGFARLFLAPGVRHCAGGPGPDGFGALVPAPSNDPAHDAVAALVRWVEQGIPPDRIVASRYQGSGTPRRIEFQRPLCPYPEVARPRPGGDPAKADGWECAGSTR